ncbi:YndM family protein [Oceanobacillus timonensis]|uniref:YndM family protein n=1 Tax=Oceanobacillus timonensis TaxID=1926285 RepID=UPI0009BA01D7|nr:YndM family protein [Oceanobacillus timonensis]
MDHLKALGIKFVVIAVVVYSLFGILYNANLMNLFWISLLVTGISYLIGDLFILRKFGNITATIADFGLAFVSIWLLGDLFLAEGMPTILLSLTAAFFITCVEPFIHVYIQNRFSDDHQKGFGNGNRLQTEFAKEMDAQMIKSKKERKDK